MFRRTRLVLTLGLLFGGVWSGTFATFSDSGTATATFTTGGVDLLIESEADDDYAFTSLEMSNMKPGDVRYAPLTVSNAGTLNFNYTMAVSATNPDGKNLRAQLTLGVRKVANTAACDSAGVGYGASLDILVIEDLLNLAAIVSRPLAVSASEVLCFKVLLPSASGDTYQGATTTATFTFNATQS